MCGSRVLTHTLLERKAELGEIELALDAATPGEGRALILRGDAGIGKTTLLEAAAESARSKGFQVLEARADPLETELSFGVCLQLFQGIERRVEERAGDLFAGAAALARPALGEGMVVGAPGEDRTLPLINGLYWLSANMAEREPTLLSVDDAHWSDVPSLQFLRFLTRRLEGIRVVLLVAARPTGARGIAAEHVSGLAEQAGVRVASPATLTEEAVGELVREELGGYDPRFAQRARGSPAATPSTSASSC